MEKLFEIACRSDAVVLLTGPTGSGKSLLARQIHDRSRRSAKPFVTVNLATLSEGTFESELFGHERGAFTGADQRRIGRLEQAQGGTVFLDEIGDLSSKQQARLLEFLQSKTISLVGSSREVKLEVRVIVATHRDLSALVAAGAFREDLFHRIRVLALELRPLSDRFEEFNEIVHGLLEDLCRATGRKIVRVSEDVARRLEGYSWPGNFRELRNVLEYAVLASEGVEITLSDLPAWFGEQSRVSERPLLGQPILGVAELPMSLDFHGSLAQFEREFLTRALRRYRGRVNQTARQIGLNKTTLIRRMRAYGMQHAGFE